MEEDLTFLDGCSIVNATLTAVLPDNRVERISDRIDPYRLRDRCPLLHYAFEHGYQNRLQASIETPSRAALIALLRYCYTYKYLPPNAEYAPLSFLLHVEVCKLAQDLDVYELQLLAQGNFTCQAEFACSLPEPPTDLVDTIRSVYIHFASTQSGEQHGIMHTLLNYCISMFHYHKLAENVAFLEVLRQFPKFQQDLCRTSMARNFEDDCAFEIIQMSLNTLQPQCGIRPTTLASRALPAEMLIDGPLTPLCAPVSNPATDQQSSSNHEEDSGSDCNLEDSAVSLPRPSGPSALALRPKATRIAPADACDTGAESSSDEAGFSLVHRPKPVACVADDEPMSSPEIIPSNPETVDILALTGSAYPDDEDDDWNLL